MAKVPKPCCPTCGKALEDPEAGPRPFCSERCRLLDLWGWLNEAYRIPIEDDATSEREKSRENGE